MNKKQSLFKTILFYGYCIIFSAFLLINLLIALLFINNSIWEDRMVDGFILVYLVFLTQPITMPANIVFLIISLFLRKKNFKYIYLIWDYLFFGYLILVLAFLGSIFIENIAWQVPLHLLFLIITVVYLYVSTNRYLKANNKIQNHAGFKYSNKFSFFLPKSSFWISLFIVTFCNIAITGFLYYKNHDPLFEIPILYIASKLLFYFFILFSTFFFLLKKHRPNAFSLIVIGLLSGDTVFFIANDKINLLSDFNLIFKVLGLVSVIFMFFLIFLMKKEITKKIYFIIQSFLKKNAQKMAISSLRLFICIIILLLIIYYLDLGSIGLYAMIVWVFPIFIISWVAFMPRKEIKLFSFSLILLSMIASFLSFPFRIDNSIYYKIGLSSIYIYQESMPAYEDFSLPQPNYRSSSHIDRSSFEVLAEHYAKDKKHVYYYGRIFEVADTETFIVLNNDYSEDKNNVYIECNNYTGPCILKDANPGSFFPY